jgi:hypothetical protein
MHCYNHRLFSFYILPALNYLELKLSSNKLRRRRGPISDNFVIIIYVWFIYVHEQHKMLI